MNFDFAAAFFLIFRAIGWIATALCLISAFAAAGSRQPDASAMFWVGATLSGLSLVALGTIGAAVVHTAQAAAEMHKMIWTELNDLRSTRRAAAKQV
jgi:uncharacterized membrane protein